MAQIAPTQSSGAALVPEPFTAQPRPRPRPRRRFRENTAPVAHSHTTQALFDNPTSSEPGQLQRRAVTEPIIPKDLRPVYINAYRLPWKSLKSYLETLFKRKLSVGSTMASDIFSVWLPRDLSPNELADIENLRLKSTKEQLRVDQRPPVTLSRPLESDEETEQ
ncbi:hypothetical protein B0T14DRAFT_561557 [Immersiella caudata]|uniref:Uncharacterized protein n=1 Tax=Immersiella caudata TaxID=314043 RepID=A0AA39XI40_9PEZI|nr:hypothetical protein B0T14DRAFT_561557 [Immersiella caudata]